MLRINPLRVLLALCICCLVAFSQALPAFAQESAPTEGETPLKKIYEESREVILEGGAAPSREESQEKSREGLNSVQGGADADEFYRPENTDAEAPEQEAKRAFEKVED